MIAGSLSYGRAQGRANLAAFAITPEVFDADKKYISRHNQYTFVSASLALVGASVSTFLWYRALREPRTRVEVNATGTGASISVGGRF
jgi:hypothetical protein